MVPPPEQGRSGETGGLVPPHGRTKHKLSSIWPLYKARTLRLKTLSEPPTTT